MGMRRNETAKRARNRLSKYKLLAVATLVLTVVAAVGHVSPSHVATSAYATTQSTAAFDFDTGSPPPSLYRNTPLDYVTSSGVAAHFSSSSDIVTPAFSVQDTAPLGYNLSMFSGQWLYDNQLTRDSLDIKFNAQARSINLTFATIEQHGGPGVEPCYINLTAYMDSTETNPVGWAWARGATSSEQNTQGTLSFNSGSQPFNLVRIGIPYQPAPKPVTDFYVDNIVITIDPQTDGQNITVVDISLFGSASNGWGFTQTSMTSPGPTITVNLGDSVNMTLTSVDSIIHNFYVDHNGDGSPSINEPKSPTFTGTVNYQFNATTAGTFTYFCQFHPSIMRGNFVVKQPATLPTDLNGDGVVNILDISIVAKAFGSKSTDPNWNEKADLDKNGQVNIIDVSRIAKDFGKTV